ncbi:hypothetical protein GGH12_000025 [Coemansia sp. RSA 1822]|nr:hypothetical protein LPJ76_001029 [Coemansia sp. RSA 638]KAJ2545489.1 hypothetical protein GGF49_000296 [Coemansia sp. RSA 1853]KAJ2567894.1 hypothetical protein GGH12_000025 [Coemansia sp. RSA 1822]
MSSDSDSREHVGASFTDRPVLGFSDSSDDDSEASSQSRVQRRKPQSKEERMLGIWADDDDVNNYTRTNRSGNGRPKGSASADILKPVGFVAAQHTPDDAQPADTKHIARSSPPSRNDSESDDSSSSSSDSDSESDTQGSPVLKPKPKPQSLPNKDFGKFASSAVWNMMAKMGYKPGEGLGMHGEGRVEPIQATLRRDGEGISFSGRETPVERTPPTTKTKAGRQAKGPSTSKIPRSAAATAAYRKTEYKTLEELERRTDATVKEIFVDMTSNLEASSLAELLTKRLSQTEREKLVHDTRLGLDLSFNRLEELNHDRAVEESRRNALTTEVDALARSIEQRMVRIEVMQALHDAIAKVGAVSRDIQIDNVDSACVGLATLYESFAQLRSAARVIEERCGFDAWSELGLERVVTDSLHGHFTQVFRGWDVDVRPDLVKQLVDPLLPYVSTTDVGVAADEMTPFESLLSRTLVPRLKQYTSTEWTPSSDTLAHVLAQLPRVTAAEASTNISAILQRTIDSINPRLVMAQYKHAPVSSEAGLAALASLRFDHSVIPWLPFIPEPSELLIIVRRKLCTALDSWTPSKESNSAMISIVSPWLELLHKKEQHKLASKVCERLRTMLQTAFEFNAQRQVVWPFKVMLKWHNIVPHALWFPVLKQHVLDSFLNYLRMWLEDTDANYAEIADWYWQWKQMYPADVFASSDIQGVFREALVYMAFAVEQKGK